MSNALAIAAVTAVLKDLLDNGLKAFKVSDIVGGDVTVSAVPPDRVATNGSEDPTQLNLFLHQVTPNQGWRNVELPSRNANGERVANPPLALNLHYLLTAYGPKDLYPEIILGHAMQLLHETPVLTREAIRKALSPAAPPPDFPAALATSQLAEQVEQLRITPETMNTEEVSKLWSALQTHYRTTAGYLVTVVLIEANHSAKTALPVAGRNAYVIPFAQPVIDSIVSDAAETAPITAASNLLIKGRQLRGEATQVRIGVNDLTAHVTSLGQTEIKLTLGPLPAGMHAGIHPVQIVHTIAMGTPPASHRGVESNVAAFVLRPTIIPSVEPGVVTSVVDGVTVKSGEIKVAFDPVVEKAQRVVLLLNELNPPAAGPARAYTFKAPAGNGVVDPNTEAASIKIKFKNVAQGDYLVRVQVDGAESPLTADVTGKYATPSITL